jgi:hypothetical protein
VVNDTTYFYVVTAIDAAEQESVVSDQVSATPADTTPPAAPTGLVATAGSYQVMLDWDDNTEADLKGYIVYRSTTSGEGYAPLGPVVEESEMVDDEEVINGITYFYTVTAVDLSGNESDRSAEVEATPSEPGGGQTVFDINQDSGLDMSDSISLLGFLFLGTPGRLPCGETGSTAETANITLLDWNGDGRVDMSDAVASLNWMFNQAVTGQAPHVLDTRGDGATCIRIVGCPHKCDVKSSEHF